ncbi:MAG TPA: AIR synthase-related protein, partial [Capillimicrobium sp.]|nr:AIR synthase-related protein [Capillimicrobium sp.]
TSSSSEMASKGEVGVRIDVRKVPLREADMEPFEIMVSESQERMLCVCEPENVDAVLEVCARWEVGGTVIGEIIEARQMEILDDGELVGVIPVEALVDDCPLYDLEPEAPSEPLYPPPPATLTATDPREVLLGLLGSANLASRQPLFEQYDWLVGSRTVRRPEDADAAVLVMPTGGAIAVAIDGNGRRVACDPYRGALEAVLECAANLACVGAEPLGLTNCLNFGNPEKPHIAWQLVEAVRGLGDGCRALDVPVVGGNVSLYNESHHPGGGPIYPTPVVGMVGELPDPLHAGRVGFVAEGDAIALVGPFAGALPGSELAKLRGEPLPTSLPEVDVAAIRAAQEAVRDAVRSGKLSSAHDVAEGGLLVAVAESCLAGGLGATLDLPANADEAALFGEGPGGFVVSGPAEALRALGDRTRVEIIGTVEGDELSAAGFSVTLRELEASHAALAALFA